MRIGCVFERMRINCERAEPNSMRIERASNPVISASVNGP